MSFSGICFQSRLPCFMVFQPAEVFCLHRVRAAGRLCCCAVWNVSVFISLKVVFDSLCCASVHFPFLVLQRDYLEICASRCYLLIFCSYSKRTTTTIWHSRKCQAMTPALLGLSHCFLSYCVLRLVICLASSPKNKYLFKLKGWQSSFHPSLDAVQLLRQRHWYAGVSVFWLKNGLVSFLVPVCRTTAGKLSWEHCPAHDRRG